MHCGDESPLEIHSCGQVLLVELSRQFTDLRRVERDGLLQEAPHAVLDTRPRDGGNRDGWETRHGHVQIRDVIERAGDAASDLRCKGGRAFLAARPDAVHGHLRQPARRCFRKGGPVAGPEYTDAGGHCPEAPIHDTVLLSKDNRRTRLRPG